jgi:hypothetical protein
MKTIKICIVVTTLSIYFFINQVNAQNGATAPKRWGADISGIGLGAFGLYQFKGTYLLNPNSNFKREIGLGVFILPESDAKNRKAFNNDGLYSANLISVTLRQYFWKGLNFEQSVTFGESKLKNNIIDGRNYSSFTVQSHSLIGYKLDLLKTNKFNLFIIGQGGVIYSYQPNKWPVKEKEPIYGIGDLKIGINF